MKFKTTLVAATMACSMLGVSAFATPEGWTEDFEAAKADAAASGKDLLMDFTGSDWCGWCIKLREEVFDTEAFNAQAFEKFVLVELDYPNDVDQSDEIKAQNEELKNIYSIEGYPTILLADATGKPYAQTGYQPGGPEAYLPHLEELRAVRVARDEAFAAAELVEGIEKAKALDVALDAVGIELAVAHYGSTIDQIVALDADDAAGLKSKYGQIQNAGQIEAEIQEAIALFEGEDYDAGFARLDKVIEDHGLQGEQLQMLTAIKGQAYAQKGEIDKAIESLQEAVAVTPDSEIAPQIKQFIEMLESQAAP